MTHDRLQRVESIFRDVRRRSQSERAPLLEEACGSDAALRAEVEAFLDVYDGEGAEFEEPALGTAFALSGDATDSTPSRIGRYRIERRLGDGATGIAYAGVQDGTGATVAVKLLRSGLREPSLLRRFEREARTLGKLHHPGIAKVYEVGVHVDGATGDRAPFIAMEYVNGPRLHEYVAEHTPDPRTRLALLAQVCDAVEHAHRQGVVHRDLKPGNILVDLSGSVPQPKVLDFGIARAIEADDRTASQRTRSGELLGTIQYMSPEQAAGATDRVSTRSDVYALGVILYEMMSGRLPYTLAGLSIAQAARVIERDEPRALGPLSGIPANDVNTIALKALEKDPARRYASAAALGDDIRRYLADEPIVAHPASVWYRMRKFTRRNRAAVAIMLVLLAAFVVSSVLAVVANMARRDFEIQYQRSLVREADALLAARGTDWYAEAMGRLREAAGLTMGDDDANTIRNLVVQCRSVREPGFVGDVVWNAVAGGAPVALEVGPSGERVIALTEDGTLWSRERATGRVLWQRAVGGHALAVAPDGAPAVGAADGGVVVCDPGSGMTRYVLNGVGAVNALAFHADGTLAVGRATGTIDLFRRETDRMSPIGAIAGHAGGTYCLEFSPQGTRLASGGHDRTLRIWDWRVGALEASAPATDPVRVIAWNPAGTIVAYATRESLAFQLFRLDSGNVVRVRGATLHDDRVVRLFFAPDNRIISASMDGTFKCWTLGLDHVATGRTATGTIVAAAGAHDQSLAAAHRDGTISMWRLERAAGSHYFTTPHTAVFVPGTNQLVTPLHVLDFETSPSPKPEAFDLPEIEAGHGTREWGVAADPNGRWLASSDHFGTVKLWDAKTRRLERDLNEGGGIAWTVAFSPDGRAVAAGVGADVHVWDSIEVVAGASSPAPKQRVLTGHTGLVRAIAWHPAAPLLLSAANDGSLRLWSVGGNGAIGALDTGGRLVRAMAFRPDGSALAAAADDGAVLVWNDIIAGAPPDLVLDGHAAPAWAVAFDDEGRYLASGDQDGLVLLRDGVTYEPILSLRGEIRLVRSLSFGARGRYLAAGCYTVDSIAWDLEALREELSALGLGW